jgi:lysophospholipase L1-like esterase
MGGQMQVGVLDNAGQTTAMLSILGMGVFRMLGLLALVTATALPEQSDFYLKDGDTVVFYGDSITDHRLYTAFTEAYVATRFPQLRVRFINSGWGGDEVTGGAGGPISVRLQRDVVAYQPTVITIMLGMNDGHYGPFDPAAFQAYCNGLTSIVQTLRQALPQARITVMEPSPYDDITRPPRFKGGYNAVLVRYGQFVRELAKRERLGIADLNTPVVLALRKAQIKDPKLAQQIIPDRVHPALAGNFLLAEELLKSWNAPAIATAVDLDAASAVGSRAENAEVSALEADNILRWTQLDKALPMPVEWKDPASKLAVEASDFMTAINRETLRIRNLPAGEYNLRIDGEIVGRFTARKLAESINLAGLDTPMSKQATEVLRLTYNHNNMHYVHWRLIQTSLEQYDLEGAQSAMNALDELENQILATLHITAQPKPHRYELTRAAQPEARAQ